MQSPQPNFQTRYFARSFPPDVIDPYGDLTFSPDDLAHALFTTGRAPGDQSRYGQASTWEFLHRTAIIPAYIRRRPYGSLSRSRLVQDLDRSELVGLSYALGMALTTIFCRQQLNVDHLLHIDRYAAQYQVIFAATRKRADLIGRTSNGWVVAEAKGRSRAPERELRTKLEQQKRAVTSIGGQPPWLALGCVASFPVADEGIRVEAYDPFDDAEETVQYDRLDLDRYLFAYYLPFISAMDFGDQTAEGANSRDAETSDFGPFGVTLGLIGPIADLTRQYIHGEVSDYSEQVQTILANLSQYPPNTFADGSIVETRWVEAMQTRDEWIER